MRFDQEMPRGTVVPSIWDVLSGGAAVAAGARQLFLSGGALAASYGYPDIGLLDIDDLTGCVRRVKSVFPEIPLLVDVETGYGSGDRLARLVCELLESGAEALMIEDQVATGQSVNPNDPGLCEPSTMWDRIRRIRGVAGTDIQILARTDRVPGVSFDQSVQRLVSYEEAGANWVLPVFLESRDELEVLSREFVDRLFVITVAGRGGYVPTVADIEMAGCRAVLVTSQNRNAFETLKTVYVDTMRRDWPKVRESQASGAEIHSLLRFDRFKGKLS